MAQIDHAKRIHLIGIGGCSMNGLALILQSQGHRVSGSDRERIVAEWVAAGATHLGRRGEEGFLWDTFADPDGNEFCIDDPEG